jgi:hypothetical protein
MNSIIADAIAYSGGALAFSVMFLKNILWIRVLVLIAQVFFLVYATINNLLPFMVINSVGVAVGIWSVLRITRKPKRRILKGE